MITTPYRIDARPFNTEHEALAAIAHRHLTFPGDVCLLQHFSREGIFVRIRYNQGTRWLTTSLSDGAVERAVMLKRLLAEKAERERQETADEETGH